MIPLLASLSSAATPAHRDGDPVPLEPVGVALEWARPFALAEPAAYAWVAGAPLRTTGWVVQLRVDPALLVPRQVGAPVFYLGTTPIAVVNADTVGGCAVGYLLAEVDPGTAPLFVGSPELPERIDDAAGRRERDAAVAQGAVPHPPATLETATTLQDLRGVYGLLAERVAACAPHETGRIATLRAQAGL